MLFSLIVGSVNYQIQEKSKCGHVNGVLDPGCVIAYHQYVTIGQDHLY